MFLNGYLSYLLVEQEGVFNLFSVYFLAVFVNSVCYNQRFSKLCVSFLLKI